MSLNDFESDDYKIFNTDSQSFCSICFIKKNHKTFHSKKLNVCIEKYQFYSKIYNKTVSGINFKKYFLVLISDLIFNILTHVTIVYLTYLDQSHVGFNNLMFNFYFYQRDILVDLIFTINLFLLIMKLSQIFVCMVCISNNLTIDELYNPHNYSYRIIKQKNFYSYKNHQKNLEFNNCNIMQDKSKNKEPQNYQKRMRYLLRNELVLFNPNDHGFKKNWLRFFKS